MTSLHWPSVIALVFLIVGSVTFAHELFEDDVSLEEYSPYLATVVPQLAQYELPELDDVYFSSPRSYQLELDDERSLDRLHRRMRRRRHLRHSYHHHHPQHHRLHHHSHSRYVERLKRQAELEGNSVEKAKAKLQHALEAAKALGGIEKQMGLDPNVIEEKTTRLKDDLNKEVTKYKDEELSDDAGEDKRTKLRKYSEFAKKDMKEADSILSLIVKLEAAKYIAAERAREELQKVQRSQIHPASDAPPSPSFATSSAMGPFQAPYQSPYLPQYKPQMVQTTPFQQNSFSPRPQYGPFLGPLNDQPIKRPLQYSNPIQGPTFGPMMSNPYTASPNVASYTANENNAEDKKEAPSANSDLHPFVADEQQPLTDGDSDSENINSEGLAPLVADEDATKPIGGLGPSGTKPTDDLGPSMVQPVNQSFAEASGKLKQRISKPKSSKVHDKGASELVTPVTKGTTTESLAETIATEGVPTMNEPKQATLTNMFTSQSAPLSATRPQFTGKDNSAQPAPLTDSFGSFAMHDSPQNFIQQRFKPQSPSLLENHFQTSPQYVGTAAPTQEPASAKPTLNMGPNSNVQSAMSPTAPMISNYVSYPQVPQQVPIQQGLAQYQPESSYPIQAPQPENPSFYWPQQAPQVYQPSWPDHLTTYGYQPPPANPKVSKAQGKVENVKKASIAVTNLEKQIGLTPGTVNNLIDNVEKSAKDEVQHYEEDMAQQKSKIESEKKLIQNDEVDGSVQTIQKEIEDHEKKLDDDKQKEQAAERKLNEIKQIEKVLTVIEAAKYSALQRAKTRLQELDAQKDILRIRKRDLEEESGLTDLKRHRRNEINIFLHGSRNKIDASRIMERKKVFNQEYKKRVKNKLSKTTHHKTFKKVSVDVPILESDNTVPSRDFGVKKSKIHHKKHHGRKSKAMKEILKKIDNLFKVEKKIMEKLDTKTQEKPTKNLAPNGGDESFLKKRSVRATSMPRLVQETLKE